MNLPDPIRGGQFGSFDIPLESVRNVCEAGGLPIPTSTHRVKKGEVNAVFKVQTSGSVILILKVWVRMPDPQDMRFEEKVVHRVREESGIPTPKWLYTCQGDESIRYPYVIMEHVEAEDADVLWNSLSRTARENLIGDCASSLRALHSLSLSPKDIPDADTPSTGTEWAEADSAKFHGAIQEIGDQGWMPKALLQECEEAYGSMHKVLKEAKDFSLVHYDFQFRNIRIDPKTSRLKAVLDFGNATIGPAITDARALNLGIFINQPELSQHFWAIYGVPDDTQRAILQLHSLTRVLDIMAVYCGPTPAGWNIDTVRNLLGSP